MKSLFRLFVFLSFFCSLFFASSTFAKIDFYFSPIKYELSLATGSTVTKPATFTNNWDEPVYITTSTSDFQSRDTSGTPQIVRKSELVYPDQEMSTWITVDTPSFTINPGEDVTVNFTIDVPDNATPWGHYAAVIFNTWESESSTTGNIWIDVDYGILVLVNVEWEVIVTGWVDKEGITIWWSSGWDLESAWWSSSGTTPPSGEPWPLWITLPSNTYDDCPLGDFTNSNFDGKCFDTPFDQNDDSDEQDDTNSTTENAEDTLDSNTQNENQDQEQDDFSIDFAVPFQNEWTVHIKPTGKVVLKDEDGEQIKAVGKEVIINEVGAVVGEKIVDYIPLNDTGGNVLPKTTRVFEGEWNGFPYETNTPEGNLIIDYWTPWEYYTNKNKQEAWFLMFWERVCEAKKHKKVTAIIDMWYVDENGEEVEFSAAKEFDIEYTEEYIAPNPYVLLPFAFVAFLIFLWWIWWLLFAVKKKKCKHCDTPVRKNWKICPKCKKKLKK